MVGFRIRIPILATLAACQGTVIALDDSGTNDATLDGLQDSAVNVEAGVDGSDEDAAIDSAWYFAQFDVYQYDGSNPPLIGEYPYGAAGCNIPAVCMPLATCDVFTGWCCSGVETTKGCICGSSLGCLPPQTCCYLPDVYVPACVDGPDACPGGKTPWNP